MNAPIQAFVLKCPECGAPQPGTTPTCTHCKVPLMWAPSRRVGSDDHPLYDVEDEPGTELMAFGPQDVAQKATAVFQFQFQKPVRPTFLWLHPRCSDDVYVDNINAGVDRLVGMNASPGILFSRGRGFPLSCDSLMPGMLLRFDVENRHGRNSWISVEGVLRCLTLEAVERVHGGPKLPLRAPNPPWGSQIVGLKGRIR